MVNQPIGNHGLRVFWCGRGLVLWWNRGVRMALVSFLSGGYNLHRFSDAIGLIFSAIYSTGFSGWTDSEYQNQIPGLLKLNVIQDFECLH